VYVDGGRVIAVVNIYKSNLTMEETLLDKGILKSFIKKNNMDMVWNNTYFYTQNIFVHIF
jgi:hypothetical protein